MKMKLTKASIVDFLMINLGTAICAAAIFFFLMPSHLAIASVSGLSIVLSNVIPLPVSAITMIFNVALLGVGFLLIGPEFGAKTVYSSLMLPVFMGVLEGAFPNFQSIMGDPFIDMVCYLFSVSAGLAIMFVRNASTGGLDIIAKLLNKYFRMELGKAMSMAGMVVALSSGLVYDAKTVVLSVLGTYLNGIVLDKSAHQVTIDGQPVELSFKEFELLCYFAENKGIALSREKILNNVWNYDYFGDARTIDTHVKKLRSKMGEKGNYIKTIWGMGYKFEVEE